MRPTFHPLLVNHPFDDPCLFINFLFENSALAFDLGEINNLAPRDILKLTHIFVSHTHIDHFAGFDRFLRLALGRDREVHLFGPENFLSNISGKLRAYTWNLTDRYEKSLRLQVTEVTSRGMRTQKYRCQDRFAPTAPPRSSPWTGTLLEAPGFTISAVILDHGIPCLGFCLKERFHINIKKEALTARGLEPGPWLQSFKKALYEQAPPDTSITVPAGDRIRTFELAVLARDIALITPGQKIVYITDVAFSPDNVERIMTFARNADHLFIEAYFLDADREAAREKKHLTAAQAGELAGRSGARRFTIFHVSPRYMDRLADIEQEARQAYDRFRT
ncbi:MAG: MBL fold metallo-hydrolase [Thermodesulfobacteriota bacterium]|nr:MBL fold metallo-hydrolase [Thermodesulfobacteriota bacterium]